MTIYDLVQEIWIPQPNRAVSKHRGPMIAMKALAAVIVPAHGYVVGASGLSSSRSNPNSFKSQTITFFKSLIRGCLWAAAIAAGMLIYTAFVTKWKEKGYPTIPISALIAAEQVSSGGGRAIPLGGRGDAQSSRPVREAPRQTSLLDMDEFEG